MKRNTWAYIVGFGGAVAFGSVHGCAFNPFSPPDYDNRPGATDVGSNSSGGAAGTGGAGGSGGVAGQGGNGGVAGQGGTAGAGGAVCVCDGVDDGNECTIDTVGACPDGDMAQCHRLEIAKPCSAGPNYICDAEGKCERECLVCTNEPWCTKRCNAQVCTDDSGCLSGYCEQGVCCNAECVGPCKSCNRAGTVGACTQLPVGLQVPGCDTIVAAQGKVDACDNDGTCTTFMSAGLPLGAGCGMHSDCISGFCDTASGCVSRAFEPCIEDLECASNLCDKATHLCKPCTNAADCREGATCASDTCFALPGEPAAAACAKGTVEGLLCVLAAGAACTKQEECSSHYCKSGICQNPCMTGADCPAGVTCDNSWKRCRLPKGAYCVPGTSQPNPYCQSGKCSGFPPRCE